MLDQIIPDVIAPISAPPQIVRTSDALVPPKAFFNSNTSHAMPSKAPTPKQTQPIHFLSGNNRGRAIPMKAMISPAIPARSPIDMPVILPHFLCKPDNHG
jgi:hypothetical protein